MRTATYTLIILIASVFVTGCGSTGGPPPAPTCSEENIRPINRIAIDDSRTGENAITQDFENVEKN